RFEELVGAAGSVGAVQAGLDSHDPPVQAFLVAVDSDGPFEGCQGLVGVVLLAEFCEPGEGVNGVAAQRLADLLYPHRVGTFGKVSAPKGSGCLEDVAAGLVVSAMSRAGQRGLEAPQVNIDQSWVDAQMLSYTDDEPGFGCPDGSAQNLADVRSAGVQDRCGPLRWGFGPERFQDCL